MKNRRKGTKIWNGTHGNDLQMQKQLTQQLSTGYQAVSSTYER